MASQWPSHPWGRPPSRSCRRTSSLRPPPIAVSHHHGVLIPPLAGATAARETGAPRAASRRDRSAPRPWPVSAVATFWPSPAHGWAGAVREAGGGWHGADKSWFLSPFGDMTLWNILASCVVLPYISPFLCVTNLMLWGHILSVAPETSSMEGGARFHLDTSHYRPGPLVTRCDRATPRGVRGR